MSIYIGPDSVNVDLTAADGITTHWPTPRSMKIDMATVLKLTLTHFGLTIPVITTGAFHPSMLRDESFKGQPVIVLQRGADHASRQAVGELNQVITATDVTTGAVLDPSSILGPLGDNEIFMKNQVSNEIVDVWIFDENDQRIEQLYLLVKIAMFSAEKVFFETLGYLEFIRTDGQDSSLLVNGAGGNFVVFQRSLQYKGTYLDFIAGVGEVARLVAEQYTETADASNAQQTVDLP